MNITKADITRISLSIAVMATMMIGGASAAIDTTNITDAINVLGIVGAGFINVLKVIFVDNLSTIILLSLIGVVLMLFGGFAQVILKFAFSMMSNIGGKLDHKYNK